MALWKPIIDTTGIEVNYWIVSKIEKDKMSETAYVVLYGYPSKEIRDEGYDFSARRFLNIYPEDYKKVFDINILNIQGMNEVKSVYEFIKKNFEEFNGAIDVLEDINPPRLNMKEESQDVDYYNDYELYGIRV